MLLLFLFYFIFFFLDLASKPTESLEQIAAFNVEKVLSKLAILSENLLLTEVWFIGNCYYSPIIDILASCLKIFYISFLPLISLIDFIFRV